MRIIRTPAVTMRRPWINCLIPWVISRRRVYLKLNVPQHRKYNILDLPLNWNHTVER
jgi:hypothetical protein